MLLLVDTLLLVVDCSFFNAVVCGKPCYIYQRFIYFLLILQVKIDTDTIELVENVREKDCIEIKSEQHCIQLVRTVESEREVSVLCLNV